MDRILYPYVYNNTDTDKVYIYTEWIGYCILTFITIQIQIKYIYTEWIGYCILTFITIQIQIKYIYTEWIGYCILTFITIQIYIKRRILSVAT